MNSSTTLNAWYDNFYLNKSKLKWKGTLEDVKAFVLAEIDANTAENVNWKSPSGGKWTFDSEALSVTWHKASENIYLKGEKSNHLMKQIYMFLTASEGALGSANPIETELDNSIDNLLADEESVRMTASTTAGVFKPNDTGKAEKSPSNHLYEHEEITSNLAKTKIKASSFPANENLNNELPTLHTTTKLHNPSGLTNSSNTRGTEIDLLKSKLESFADEVTTTLSDLAYELNTIKENKPYSIVVLENVIHELKEEKTELLKANDELREHNTNMSHVIAELRLSNKNLENEKSSLLTAIQLIQNDYNQCSRKINTTERPWNVVTNHRSNQNQSKSLFNSINDTAVGKAPINNNVINYSSVNRYEILSDSNAELSEDNEEPILTQDEVTTRQKKISINKGAITKPTTSKEKRKTAPQRNVMGTDSATNNREQSNQTEANDDKIKRSQKTSAQASKSKVVIIGYFMIKHLDPKRIQNGLQNRKVTIKTFPGARIDDMKHYAVPTLATKPNTLIVHIGTNDLRNNTPSNLLSSLEGLGEMIMQYTNKNTNLIWSEIITRTDDPTLTNKVNLVNNSLARLCETRNWGLIKNNNITGNLLNNSGLHLNKQGTAALAKNIKQCIISHHNI